MATNQTQYYELSQWEEDDYVVRTDFNSDNLKVDTALHSIARSIDGAGKVKLLYEKSHLSHGFAVLFTFLDLDLSAYKMIIIDIDATTSGNNDIMFILNNDPNCSYTQWGEGTAVQGYCGKLNKNQGGANRIVLFSPFSGEYPISLLNFPSGRVCEFGTSAATFSTLHTLVLASSTPTGEVDSGAKVKIWGIE